MHVASWVHYAEAEDIVQDSTSMDSIWRYLQEHYNITTKGSSFLNIYYKQYKGAFINNLRRLGNLTGVKKNRVLLKEDDVLGDTIVMWALKEIDPQLP